MSKLLIDDSPLFVLPKLAVAIGINEAIILQQIHFVENNQAMGRIVDGRKWFHMTLDEWHEKSFPWLTPDTIGVLLRGLQKLGLLDKRQDLNQTVMDKTNWYSINRASVEALESKGRKSPDGDANLRHDDVPKLVSTSDTMTGKSSDHDGKIASSCHHYDARATKTPAKTPTSTSCQNANSRVSTDEPFELKPMSKYIPEKPKRVVKEKKQLNGYNPVTKYIDFQKEFYSNDAKLLEREKRDLTELGNAYPEAAFWAMLKTYREDVIRTGHPWNFAYLVRNHTKYGRVSSLKLSGENNGINPATGLPWDPESDDELDYLIAQKAFEKPEKP